MMKAVRYDEFGGIDELRVDEVERPVPGDGQVLVRGHRRGRHRGQWILSRRRGHRVHQQAGLPG